MLKRSWPRAITASSTANGNTVASSVAHLAGVEQRVVAQLAARDRARRPAAAPTLSSAKNDDASSGVYLRLIVHVLAAGSAADAARASRRPSRQRRRATRSAASLVAQRSSPPAGPSVSRKRRVSLEVELRIARLDAQEEPVAAGQREPRHVEDRVIRHAAGRSAPACRAPPTAPRRGSCTRT